MHQRPCIVVCINLHIQVPMYCIPRVIVHCLNFPPLFFLRFGVIQIWLYLALFRPIIRKIDIDCNSAPAIETSGFVT